MINANQQDFMENMSCQINQISFFEIKSLIGKDNCIDVIYRDFCKTFDIAPHSLAKNQHYKVSLEYTLNCLCKQWSTSSRVPQVLVPGLVLFNLFMNGMEVNIKSLLIKYADNKDWWNGK